jgi:methylmalonyl-CoA mutase N-terminal domain/subunit
MLRFHTQTAGSTLTAQQPDNNIVRVAIQTLAAVLGGTQSLHTNSRDEALALPSEDSVRIALRTQQIVAHESGVANTTDPLAGSYLIESMTNQIEKKATEYTEQIDKLGGMIEAIEKGYVQRQIQDSAYQYQKQVEDKERIVVGVNEFTTEEENVPLNLLKVDEAVERKQIEKLKKIKQSRDNVQTKKALEHVREVARTDENLLPPILEAVKTYATLGEICDVLRQEFGEYEEQPIL